MIGLILMAVGAVLLVGGILGTVLHRRRERSER